MLVVLVQRNLPAILANNIGRLIWLKAGDNAPAAEAALPYFERALESDPTYPQARIGAALLNIQNGHEDEALAHWNGAEIDPSVLVAYGDKAYGSGSFNEALLLYKDSASLGAREGPILAGTVCQRALYETGLLSGEKQDICKDYFANNGNNMIVNAGFGSGDLTGWTERYWSGFSGSYGVGDSTIARIQGERDGQVGAVSQDLTLPAGTEVRFSARIKADLDPGANVRLLHAVWTKPDGEPGGNQLATIDEDLEWDHVERIVQLPPAGDGTYTFSPAILTGKGDVWIDDVQLEIISEL